jgi:hypothetical protein
MSKKITALLCIKTSASYDGANLDRTKILLASLSAFWKDEHPVELIVICPSEELNELHRELGWWERVRIRLIDEELVIPGISTHSRQGWFKQQALKLAAHRFVQTPYYIIVEPDVICCQPIGEADLVIGDKAVTQWIDRRRYPLWYEKAAEALKMQFRLDWRGFDVTPQILSTAIARALGEELLIIQRKDPWLYLLDFRAGWTEYTLYDLMGDRRGLLDRYHLAGHEAPRKLHALFLNNNGEPGDFPDWDFRENFEEGPNKGLFIVFQSSLRVLPSTIWSRVAPFIEPRLPAGVREKLERIA